MKTVLYFGNFDLTKLVEYKLNFDSFFFEFIFIDSPEAIIDPSDKIWAGTLGQGVVVFEPHNKSFQFVNVQKGLVNDNILSIAISGHKIWVATLGGSSVISLDEQSKVKHIQAYNKEDGLSSNFIYTVFPDSRGRVWFGTDGNGIIKLEEDIFYSYDENQGVTDNIIYSINLNNIIKIIG